MNLETLETNRLLLKALTPADIKYIFENNSKPQIKNILGHRTEEDYLKEEYKHLNGYSSYKSRFITFLLTDKASNQIIGRCSIHNWYAEHHRAEVGYHMQDESYKRKGLMTEALGAVIQYGFNKLNLQRLEAVVGAQNIPSLRLMEKYNFIKEGFLRQYYFTGHKYEDSVLFSKLLSEFVNEV